jgi:hypothetical protein
MKLRNLVYSVFLLAFVVGCSVANVQPSPVALKGQHYKATAVLQGGLNSNITTQVNSITDTNATGGNEGPGTINLSGGFYVNGVSVGGGLATPITVSNGGRQCGSAGIFSALPVSPVVNENCGITDATACVAGTAVTSGSGGLFCSLWWNGSGWIPGGGATSAASGGVSSVGGTGNIASSGGANPVITFTGILPIGSGGNGTATPSLTAGANITITGTWPFYTISASGSGGGVSSVTATAPFTSTGGTTPVISGSTHGNGSTLQRFTGTSITNDCAKFDANGNIVDNGSGCAGVGTPGGTNGQIQYNNSGAFGGLAQVPIGSGGTGTSSPSLVAGSNITITGPWPNQTITSSAGSSFLSTIDVTCNNTSDTAALTTAFNSGAYLVKSHGPCTLGTPISLSSSIGSYVNYVGDGAPWTCLSTATCLTITTAANNYPSGSTFAPHWDNLYLKGPASTGSSVGLQVNGNNLVFNNTRIYNFNTGLQFGANAYILTFNQYQYIGDGTHGTGINCPTVSNNGESVNFFGGSVINNAISINNNGCEMQLDGMSLDNPLTTAIINSLGSNGNEIIGHRVHVEWTGSQLPSSNTVIELTGKNGYTSVRFTDSSFQTDSFPATPVSIIGDYDNTASANVTNQVTWGQFVDDVGQDIAWPNGQGSVGGIANAAVIYGGTKVVNGVYTGANSGTVAIAVCGVTSLDGGGSPGNINNVGQCP